MKLAAAQTLAAIHSAIAVPWLWVVAEQLGCSDAGIQGPAVELFRKWRWDGSIQRDAINRSHFV